jgi:hypothetical protein
VAVVTDWLPAIAEKVVTNVLWELLVVAALGLYRYRTRAAARDRDDARRRRDNALRRRNKAVRDLLTAERHRP